MGPIHILFGTESGNAEMVADDIADALGRRGLECEIRAMDEYNVADLAKVEVAVLITSTYGDGELPMTTAPFHDALLASRPDLGSLRFAAFGLGDSTYDTFNNAIEVLSKTLIDLGATQIGDIGKHDASGPATYTEAAVSWIDDAIDAADLG
jgi:MioC protein